MRKQFDDEIDLSALPTITH